MSKKIQISVPVPCHENWDAMTPVEKGKFCGSCQKQVVDFSNMSDREIAQFFKKPSTGSVCGRFMNDQLDRDIEIPKKRIPFAKYLFNLLLPAFLLTKLSAQKTIGKIIPPQNRDTIPQKATEELRTLGMMLPTQIQPVIGDTVCVKPTSIVSIPEIIKGKVVDEYGHPIPFASVTTSVPGKGVPADEKGEFSISKDLLGEDLVLQFSAVGFEMANISLMNFGPIDNNGLIATLRIFEDLDEIILKPGVYSTKGRVMVGGAVSVIRYVKKSPELISNDIKKENEFLIYPNPVSSNSDITINWKEKEEGYYSFLLMNQAGQSVQQKEIWIDADARQLNLPLPSVAAGNYFIVLVNKKSGKRFSEKIIIR